MLVNHLNKSIKPFRPVLKQIINPAHELSILADKIPWKKIEDEFSDLYADKGSPAKPIRLMAGLLALKQIFHISDEKVIMVWLQNPYFQYFCGEAEFQWQRPCSRSDLFRFRQRIGENGVALISGIVSGLYEKKSFLRRLYDWLRLSDNKQG